MQYLSLLSFSINTSIISISKPYKLQRKLQQLKDSQFILSSICSTNSLNTLNQFFSLLLLYYIMEKKKVLEPTKSKIKEKPLLSAVFMRQKANESSATLFELHDTCILSYTTTEPLEPHKKISFDFDLIFQMMKGSTEDEIKKRSGHPFALKFERQGDSFFMYHQNELVLKEWRDILATKVNQRGFHQLFKPIKKIGKGNFASVYLAIRLEDEKKFAIKAFSKEATYAQDKGKQSLINQIQLMRKFNHKNLMRLFQVYESDNSIYISVQLLQGGQLYDKIKTKMKFSSEQIQSVMRGLLLGLEHMHAKRVMHRDLKPQNILFRKQGDYDCVIADFGLATWADEPEYLFVRCGTPGYVAPEIVNIKDMKAKCDPICDLFSVGVIFHILLTGKSPFPGKTYNQVLAQNRACNINFQTQECLKLSQASLDLLVRLLDKSPKSRLSATEALKHPFFSNQFKTIQTPKQQQSIMAQNVKYPLNKTSIMVNTGKNSIMCNSPLMTSANPFRKNNQQPLKDDSCVKFKMRENIMTGKTESLDSHDTIQSPMLKRNMMNNGQTIKESRFGGQKKMETENQE